MNIKEIKELMELLKNNDITEIEIEREGVKLKLKKGSPNPVITPSSIINPQPVMQHVNPPVVAHQQIETSKENKHQAKENTITITSPMVGTFYRSPSPDSPVFLNEGDVITEGKTVCVIEAMKLMNEIKAEVKGKVIKILVENGHPVEFGEALFIIEPA